jgi:acyl-CoA synthetase (AMP-forming)/AMP-acid ligase II
MSTPETVLDLTEIGRDGDPAILAPDRSPLSFAALRAQARETIAALNRMGIGGSDRVALVLPNGPEMATAFVAVAAGAVAAPLNPAYRAEEFEFYLSDLGAKAVIVEAGAGGPTVDVAQKLGVRIVELRRRAEAGAGAFDLAGVSGGATARPGPARADDMALILHTSGTTSRPKIVPLSQRNVCVSASNIASTLALSASDRGLNVMPLFHIHGLMAGLLAPWSRGGAVFCTPGFNALKFFAWMREARPTWYTAVPTMHQAILTRAAQHRDVIAANPLRFVRSSSSSMPPQVIAEIEATFGAPLIESYGMTEAAH